MTIRDAALAGTGRPWTHAEAPTLAQAAYDRFATLVEQLSEEEWALPTDCPDWTVRDLVGHMVGAMRSAASPRELLSQYREIARRHAEVGGDQTDVMTAVQVRRTSSLTTAEITAECRALVGPATVGRRRTPALLRRFVRFPVQVGEEVESWTLGYLVDTILTRDAWMHAVDLARATGRSLPLSAEIDGRIVADVVREWGGRHRRPYDLRLTGLAGGRYSSGHSDEPRLEVDAVEFCRLVSGRGEGTGLLATAVPF